MKGLPKCSGISRHFPALLVLVGVLLVVSTADVLAQSGRQSVTITVSRNAANACVYEIDGEVSQDQDLFLVRPNAAITFRATGTNARVDVDRETRGPRKGTRGLAVGQSATFDLTNGGDPVVRNARRSFGRRTLHKVWIFCLDSEGNEEISTDKASASGTALFRPLFQELSSEFITYGPSDRSAGIDFTPADSTEERRRGAGGPEMEVEDP